MITAIGFSGGWRPGQIVIQATTFDLSAHCFAVKPGGKIIDATYEHDVAERRLSEVKSHWMEIIPASEFMTVDQAKDLDEWLQLQIGKKYDKGFVLGYPYFGRHWQDDDEWCCSELIGAGLVEVGVLTIPKLHRLTPRNLRRRIKEVSR